MEMNFSETMKQLRKERGNTQEELGVHLGISVQAVSKWERGDGMPDITLLPHIAAYYDTTVDFLLGCDSIRKRRDIEEFKEKAQELINKGKRRERLELCREYQKKYPNDECVLFRLMHDLFSVDSKENSEEIISIANRLLKSSNTEYHFGAVQLLALTNSKIGNYEAAIEYASRFPTNIDILRCVLKGNALAEHCKWYFWRVCDSMYLTAVSLTGCAEANYTPRERHKIRRSVYDVFKIVFSDGDFGFWEDRLARLCLTMAKSSVEIGENDRAFSELSEMCEHIEKYQSFEKIDHTSPLVKGLHYEEKLVGKSSDSPLASGFLSELGDNAIFNRIKDDARFIAVIERLQRLV